MKTACALGMLLLSTVSGSLEASSLARNVGVMVTGQTGCWDSDGSPTPCTGTGQDGESQKGWTMGRYPRFGDTGDGTVKDNLTGLIWLKDANCFGLETWANALVSANTMASGSCGLTDGSVAGDWRLPNVKELQSLVDYGNFDPALPTGHPFFEVQLDDFYWSSSSRATGPSIAWSVSLFEGIVFINGKTSSSYVWPVRGGR